MRIHDVHSGLIEAPPEVAAAGAGARLTLRQHRALVEDLLDRAELAATGRVARAAGALPPARRGSPAGLAAAGVLGGLAALHAAWALGSRWPADDDAGLARLVLADRERELLLERTGRELPADPLTWAVAAGLLAAAGIVAAVARGASGRAVRATAWAVAGVLAIRGVAGAASSLVGGASGTYERLDLFVYSPLCLALAAGAALTARRAGRHPRARRSAAAAA